MILIFFVKKINCYSQAINHVKTFIVAVQEEEKLYIPRLGSKCALGLVRCYVNVYFLHIFIPVAVKGNPKIKNKLKHLIKLNTALHFRGFVSILFNVENKKV